MAFQASLQIAAGNNNAAGLSAFETAVTINGKNEYGIQSWGNYTEGVLKFKADGTSYFSGFPSTSWIISVMDFDAYWTLRNTYCSGGITGLVTIKSNTTRHGTYANYNATMILPQPSEFTLAGSRALISNFAIRFVHLVGL